MCLHLEMLNFRSTLGITGPLMTLTATPEAHTSRDQGPKGLDLEEV